MSDSSSNETEPKLGAGEKVQYVSGGLANDLDHLAKLEHFTDGSSTTEDIEIISAHLDDRTIEECRQIIEQAIKEHDGDVALDNAYYNHLIDLVSGAQGEQGDEEWETIMKFEAFLIHDWSIYPSVRSVTRPIDEEEYENYENIRVYLISVLWSCAGSVLATFFAVRFPSISLNGVASQILIAYSGRLFAYIPDFSFPVGFGRRCHFGGGKWNFKEQMLATCGMGVGNVAPYSQNVVISMANEHFYGFQDAQGNFGFTILLTLATNLMGFGFAGSFRIFLVYPVRMIWYAALPGIRLSRVSTKDSEKERENIDGWKLRGPEFFWLFTVVFFGWFWITDFLFQFLSTFDWIAWISHEDNDSLAICGVNGGLGFNPISTFDPSLFMPTAMIQPLFATVCMLVGMLFSFLVIVGIWYMNISWTAYLPINSNGIFDNTGNTYDVNAVLDKKHNLDVNKYKNYSMPLWTAANLVVYGSFFAFYPAMIMFASLNYSRVLLFSFKIFGQTIINPKKALSSFNDRFSRSQRKYKEVPEWWYLFFLIVCIALGIAFVEHYEFSNTPVWTIFFGVGLSGVFMIPSGVLYATTNQQIIINVLYELVIGSTVEGNGTALMVSKAFATNFMVETDTFISNLKQAHYVGLAPRAMFRIQIFNCIANSFVQSGLIVWQSTPGSIPNSCDPKELYGARFTCADIRTYFSAAVQWGTIGPRRVMRDLYPRLRYTFLAGALFPVPFWIVRSILCPMARKRRWADPVEGGSRFRNSRFIRYVRSCEWVNSFNELVFLAGCLNWAPYNFMYYLPWSYVGLAFQWYLPKYHLRWWSKYNYLLYAAISVGYTYADLIMFFATEYHHKASIAWWGNVDGVQLSSGPRLPVPASGTFGPTSWEN